MIKRVEDLSNEKYSVEYSHKCPEDKVWYERSLIALLIRDPRDVVVSRFFQITRRRKKECPENLSDFIRDPKWGIESVIHFYNEWYRMWQSVPQCILLTYENLQRDCYSEFSRLLNFFSIEVEEEIIRNTIDYCSFDNMQRREYEMSIAKPNKIGWLGAGNVEDFESYKVRRGKVGGYVDYLSSKDIEYLEEHVEQLKGYEMYKGNEDDKL